MNDNVYYQHALGKKANFVGAKESVVQINRMGMFLCEKGHAELTLDSKTYSMGNLDLILYFPLTSLSVQSYSDNLEGDVMAVSFDSMMPLLGKISDIERILSIRQSPLVHLTSTQYASLKTYIDIYLKLRKRIADHKRNGELRMANLCHMQMSALLDATMVELVTLFAYDSDAMFGQKKMSRREAMVQRFIIQLYQNYITEHEVSFYADKQFVSTRYFSNVIKERTGKNPSEWIADALLNEAKHQLKDSTKSIKSVAEYLHFPSQSYFGKWFKNLTGMSPLEYQHKSD